jgi:hypothetical protein
MSGCPALASSSCIRSVADVNPISGAVTPTAVAIGAEMQVGSASGTAVDDNGWLALVPTIAEWKITAAATETLSERTNPVVPM